MGYDFSPEQRQLLFPTVLEWGRYQLGCVHSHEVEQKILLELPEIKKLYQKIIG